MAGRRVTMPSGLPTYTLGWGAARWAAQYLRHPNGPRAGQPWEFTPSQLRFLLWWYALDDEGRWLYTHGARRLAKGSGKSPFAATLALIELLGPVRLDCWDADALGGVAGKPVPMPLVQIAATAETQTANTMRAVTAMAPKGGKLNKELGLDSGKTVMYTPGAGKLEVITSSYRAQEGAEPSCVIADETEHWVPNNGGIELSGVLARNLAKSGARMVETCNAWSPGEDSAAEATWDGWELEQEGRTRGRARTLYDARFPESVDLTSPEDVHASLDVAYGDCHWIDKEAIADAVWDPRTDPSDALRFYFNLPSAPSDAWVTLSQWRALTDASHGVADGEDIALFFDGSKSGDASALVGCRLTDGHVFTIGVWEPRGKDTEVPVAEVDATVERAFDRWTVWAFFSDVKEWESFTKVTWPDRYHKQLQVWAQPSGQNAASIAWDMRSKTQAFTFAVELTETEITEGRFTHDGDDRLARHVANCRRRPNRWGMSVGKESPKSPRKIDAAVAMVGARMVRRQVVETRKWRRHTGGRSATGKAITLD